MNISIIGTGYVGLVSGACLADKGNNVICVDSNKEIISKLNQTIVPIYEPGLEELIKSNVDKNRLSFTTNLELAVKSSDICIIAVGTPQEEDGSADLWYVYDAVRSIAKAMNEYKLIVDKSTVPVGTAEKISKIIKENTNIDFDVVSNPEFLKQGNAVNDFLNPDRIIIGSDSDKASSLMKEIYLPFAREENKLIFMDVKSAEMTKYAANAFLATKISFINEIANLCEKVGADIEKVRTGISKDPRIGAKFLNPGIGYGGSCLPKDVKAIIKTGEKYSCELNIIKAAEHVNNNQIKIFTDKIDKEFNSDLSGKTFAILGLSYKPETNDMRFAPSIPVIEFLLSKGAVVKAYDPKAVDNAKFYFEDKIEYCKNTNETITGADAIIITTEWDEFKHLDFEIVKNIVKNPVIFDGRNLYEKEYIKNFGFKYYRVG